MLKGQAMKPLNVEFVSEYEYQTLFWRRCI